MSGRLSLQGSEWPAQAIAQLLPNVARLARLTQPSVAELLRKHGYATEADAVEAVTNIVTEHGISLKQCSRQTHGA